MARALVLLLALSAGVASAKPSRLKAHVTPIEFVGNVVLADDVYRTVLAVAEGAKGAAPAPCPPPAIVREIVQLSCTASVASSSVTVERPPLPTPSGAPSAEAKARLAQLGDLQLADEAQEVEDIVSDFLRASGYELAHVDAYPRNGRIIVELDEGRLDKVVFLGQNVFRTLELQSTFELPGNVFNRPLVEEHLAEVKRLFGLEGARFELATLDVAAAERVDADEGGFLRHLEVLKPSQAHELRVTLIYPERRPGFSLDVVVNSVNGLMLEGSYLFKGVALSDDRFTVNAGVGARFVDPLSNEVDRVSLARVRFGTRWSSPGLGVPWLRSTLGFEGDLRGRRRFDLDVRQYFYFTLRGELALDFAAEDVFGLSLGGGIEQAYLFGVKPFDGATLGAEVTGVPGESFRPYLRARANVRFNPGEVRVSRDHALELEGRYYPKGDLRADYGWADLNYRFTQMFGFEELRVRAEATLVEGDVAYPEQIQLGVSHLNVAYQQTFVDQAAVLGLEFRYALNGDRLKLGVFDTVGVVRGLRADPERPELLNEVGLGAHFLWLDSLEIDTYFGVGMSTQRLDELSFGFLLLVRQAY